MPMRLIRNHEIRLLLVASVAAVVAISAFFMVLVFRINQTNELRKQVSENCQGLEKIKSQIRGVFEENLARTESRDDLDSVQKRAIVDYYNRQIRRFMPQDCPSP